MGSKDTQATRAHRTKARIRNVVEARKAKTRKRLARSRAPQSPVARFMRFAGSSLLCTALD